VQKNKLLTRTEIYKGYREEISKMDDGDTISKPIKKEKKKTVFTTFKNQSLKKRIVYIVLVSIFISILIAVIIYLGIRFLS